MNDQQFEYDVFLSHSSADKEAVRELAKRLKGDGLRVWFDEWVIQPGDSILLAIEKGLENSRTLVLVMSQAAFDSEWVTLERHTVLFRDPTNQQRRFIPLRLDDCEIKDLLKQYAYVDWRTQVGEEYARLLAACKTGSAAQAEFERRNEDRAIRAGEAFKRLMDNDPELRESVDRLRPKMEQMAAELQRQFQDYTEYFEASFDEPAPKSIEDWTRLATRAGLDPNWILQGHWSPREVAPYIEGYLQRHKDNRMSEEGTDGESEGNESEERSYEAIRVIELEDTSRLAFRVAGPKIVHVPIKTHYRTTPMLQEVPREELPDQQDTTGIFRLEEELFGRECAYRRANLRDLFEEFKAVVANAQKNVPRFVVLGPPGSGKTTLLQWLSWQFSSGKWKCNNRRLIAVRVRLADWQKSGGARNIHEYLASNYPHVDDSPSAEQWKKWLQNGDLLLLLDGLDEISRNDNIFASRLQAALKYKRCPTVLTCRTISFQEHENFCRQFPIFTLAGLDDDERDRFIQEYPAEKSDRFDADQLIAQLQQTPQIWPIASNPLLLGIICFVVDSPAGIKALPATRGQLYDQTIEKLLHYHQRTKVEFPGVQPQVATKREVLERVALDLFASGPRRLVFTTKELLRAFHAALNSCGYGNNAPLADALLADFVNNSGLLREHNQEELFFLHLTLQEFLVASALARLANEKGWTSSLEFQGEARRIDELIMSHSLDPGWREIITLLAGQLADPSELFTALSDSEHDTEFRHRLAVAAACLPELPLSTLRAAKDTASCVSRDAFAYWWNYKQAGASEAIPHFTFCLSALALAKLPVVEDHDLLNWFHLQLLSEEADLEPVLDAIMELNAVVACDEKLVSSLASICLHNDDEWTREKAAEVLTNMGAKTIASRFVLPKIMSALADDEEELRTNAALALQKIWSEAEYTDEKPALDNWAAKHDSLVPRLINLSLFDNEDVRYEIRSTLGNMSEAVLEHDTAFPIIMQHLEDEDEEIRALASELLSDLIPSSSDESESRERFNRRHARYAPFLATLALRGMEEVRDEAAEALEMMAAVANRNDEIVGMYLSSLDDESSNIRERALELLGKLGNGCAQTNNTTIRRVLSAALHDPVDDVRYEAERTLGELQDAAVSNSEFVSQIKTMLASDVYREQELALSIIGGLGKHADRIDGLVESVVELFCRADGPNRVEAIRALNEMNVDPKAYPEIVEGLTTLIDRLDWGGIHCALQIVPQLEAEINKYPALLTSVKRLVLDNTKWYGGGMNVLADLVDYIPWQVDLVPTILDQFENNNGARFPFDNSVEKLIQAWSNLVAQYPRAPIRILDAILALRPNSTVSDERSIPKGIGSIWDVLRDHPETMPKLLKAMRHSDRMVRVRAIKLVGWSVARYPELIPILLMGCNDETWEVRHAAWSELGSALEVSELSRQYLHLVDLAFTQLRTNLSTETNVISHNVIPAIFELEGMKRLTERDLRGMLAKAERDKNTADAINKFGVAAIKEEQVIQSLLNQLEIQPTGTSGHLRIYLQECGVSGELDDRLIALLIAIVERQLFDELELPTDSPPPNSLVSNDVENMYPHAADLSVIGNSLGDIKTLGVCLAADAKMLLSRVLDSDHHRVVRSYAAVALGQISGKVSKPPESFESYRQLFRDDDWGTRLRALRGCWHMPSLCQSLAPSIVELLRDPQHHVRCLAFETLEKIGPPILEHQAFFELLDHPVLGVRRNAIRLIIRTKGLEHIDEESRKAYLDQLFRLGETECSALLAIGQHPELLASDSSIADRIDQLAQKSEDSAMRETARWCLRDVNASSGGQDFVHAIQAAILAEDYDFSMRSFHQSVVTQLDTEFCTEPFLQSLLKQVKSADVEKRLFSVQLITILANAWADRFDGIALGLLPALDDKDVRVRGEALRAFHAIKNFIKNDDEILGAFYQCKYREEDEQLKAEVDFLLNEIVVSYDFVAKNLLAAMDSISSLFGSLITSKAKLVQSTDVASDEPKLDNYDRSALLALELPADLMRRLTALFDNIDAHGWNESLAKAAAEGVRQIRVDQCAASVLEGDSNAELAHNVDVRGSLLKTLKNGPSYLRARSAWLLQSRERPEADILQSLIDAYHFLKHDIESRDDSEVSAFIGKHRETGLHGGEFPQLTRSIGVVSSRLQNEEAALPVLLDALKSEHRWARYYAAEAMGQCTSLATEAPQPLIKAAEDPDGVVRYSAIRALGVLIKKAPDVQIASVLVAALQDPIWELNNKAFAALRCAPREVLATECVRRELIHLAGKSNSMFVNYAIGLLGLGGQAAADLHREVIDTLVDQLDSEDTQSEALLALVRCCRRGQLDLPTELNSDRWINRITLEWAQEANSGRASEEDLFQQCAEGLYSDDHGIRCTAATALSEWPERVASHPALIDDITRICLAADHELGYLMPLALGNIAQETPTLHVRILPNLLRLFEHGNELVRGYAIWGLSHLRPLPPDCDGVYAELERRRWEDASAFVRDWARATREKLWSELAGQTDFIPSLIAGLRSGRHSATALYRELSKQLNEAACYSVDSEPVDRTR